jgi:transcription antitermination factor NusG
MYRQEQVCIEGHGPHQQSAILDGPWHVLHVRSNYEKRVAQSLGVHAIEHYLPLYQQRVKWTDRSVISERPLFPGYVFARFVARSRITVIGTPGVAHSLGDDPGHLISDAEIDRIRKGLSGGLLLRPHPQVSVGMRVRIRDGVFAGAEGIVADFRQQCKVVICLTAVQQSFSLTVEFSDLEITDKRPIGANPHAADAHGSWRLQTAKP